MNKKFRTMFFGSPDFAVPTLKALVESGREVAAVVTQPDRPKGRGRKPSPPPVKVAAEELNIDVVQPEKINTEDFYRKTAEISPDVLVVVAFGQIFSEKLLSIPPRGAINVHASLLPKYRGAAPIHRAIIGGETETGVTAMYMAKKLDAGDILLASRARIGPEDTSGTLHDRLAELGAKLLVETLDMLEQGRVVPQPQDHSRATFAPKLEKDDGRIDWHRSPEEIERFVRGMTPWPGAFTFLEDKRIKIFKAVPAAGVKSASPGLVLQGFENELRVATGEGGALSIIELQGASGKRLHIRDFLLGNDIPPGAVLT